MKHNSQNDKDARLTETGSLIADLRDRRSITQDDLADRVNRYLKKKRINRNTISRIENGSYDPHLTTFFGIADTFHVTPNDISPKALLTDTPLERYAELTAKSRAQLRRMIEILIEGQNDSAE